MATTYASLFDNCALYLPAISASYAKFVQRTSFSRRQPISVGDLNFLDPDNGLFFYPWALYSAGQVVQGRSWQTSPDMVSTRNRSCTTVIGDSGGYQILTGAGIVFEGPETTRRMMRWMESVADYSMTLDFPTGGIQRGNMEQHAARLERDGHSLGAMSLDNGQSRHFNACLKQTLINNDQFVAEHTPGATKFLNVLQGRNEEESSVWFDAVKCYPFQGWAFSGANCTNFSLLLRRLIDMRDQGILENIEWLHMLGVSRLELACLYTSVQRAVRKHVNPRFQISFDSASPFQTAANFNAYSQVDLDPQGWSIKSVNIGGDELIDSEAFLLDHLLSSVYAEWVKAGQGKKRPLGTEIARKVKVGDICVSRNNNAAWEGESSMLVMNHNVQALIEAVRTAHIEYFGNDVRNIPVRTQARRQMIEQVFHCENPRKLIDEYRPWLDDYAQ